MLKSRYKRGAALFVVLTLAGCGGVDKDKAADSARAISRSYRKRIRRFAEMGYLEVWYNRIDDRAVMDTLSAKARRRAERITAKAREKGHVQVLEKLTEQVDGEHRIIEEVPLIVRETHLENGTPINDGELVRNLEATKAITPEPELQFEPDQQASYDLSIRVLNVIKGSGVSKFGFVGNEKYREFGKAG